MNENILPFSTAYQTDRIKLIDKVPLNQPLCICIEPTNICNFKCLMCWQSTEEYKRNGGPFINMSMYLFDKIITDIKKMCSSEQHEPIKLMKLYSTGEPLLNKNIAEMIRLIKQENICQQLEVTTNASLLTEDFARAMVDYDLDYLRASIYSVYPERQKRVTQSSVTPQQIRDNIAFLYKYREERGKKKPFICAKIMDTHDEENDAFKDMYKDVSDEQIIDIPWIIPKVEENALVKLYGGQEEGDAAQEAYINQVLYKNRKVCRYPFTHLTIRSNGDAVVCCTDWSRDTLLGNVKEKTIEEIWNSKKLYDFRVMMLKTKGEKHPLCATCEIPLKDCPEDNLDDLPLEKLSYSNE